MAAKRARLVQRRKVIGLSQEALASTLWAERSTVVRGAPPVFRDHFLHRHHALCLLKLGYADRALGEREAAGRHLQESVGIFDRPRLSHYDARAREALRSVRTSQLAT
jgi:hypothetical protein